MVAKINAIGRIINPLRKGITSAPDDVTTRASFVFLKIGSRTQPN